jgi:hypothetical protein
VLRCRPCGLVQKRPITPLGGSGGVNAQAEAVTIRPVFIRALTASRKSPYSSSAMPIAPASLRIFCG